TSSKASNLPLLLPWAIALLPSLKLIRRWPVRTATVCVIALLASFLPTAILNARYCGDWSGLAPEGMGAHKKPALLAGMETASIAAATVRKQRAPTTRPTSVWQNSIQLAPFISLLVVLANSNVGPTRVIAPYYALLIPIFLASPVQERIVKQHWWRGIAFAVFGVAVIVVIVSPP